MDITEATIPALVGLRKDLAPWGDTDLWIGTGQSTDPTYDHTPDHLRNLSLAQHGTPKWSTVQIQDGYWDLRFEEDCYHYGD